MVRNTTHLESCGGALCGLSVPASRLRKAPGEVTCGRCLKSARRRPVVHRAQGDRSVCGVALTESIPHTGSVAGVTCRRCLRIARHHKTGDPWFHETEILRLRRTAKVVKDFVERFDRFLGTDLMAAKVVARALRLHPTLAKAYGRVRAAVAP